MTPETLLLNVFFGYFFSFGDYLPLLFGGSLLVLLFAGVLKIFLVKD